MKNTMIGTSVEGLVSGECLSDFRHEVISVDRARPNRCASCRFAECLYRRGRFLKSNMDRAEMIGDFMELHLMVLSLETSRCGTSVIEESLEAI